ncbi:bifunctional demethylmenaquinone methyltransferase/2-methoxy-6-polyprenyl-1,4-benzoquinol methylase UbiE [Candidatus Erwinia haradaeae]|uniref:Ubiquinone/menaquinone biosynthesis C-methyltransferase UbiE n=1 Tax=Candidatus Erwinia haradaeae TaxID=1922217 RepID=A0A451DAU6_9GAMM|nr:bifunctional demethylmenaquinone methyltransferase/2-methoxy-6-polyprenyl-1,4-benzoquinol methylase UbiE [Candidatus Erwinia haradaeae]VFP83346.1 Ubiquinone/menaquinone biosynthesis C-methyltransferase UbiE [Candidatus Erwinia haradaeae]
MTKTVKDTTLFGYRTVLKKEKQHLVSQVFSSVASKYDLMNDLMSFGVHRIWKRWVIEYSGVKPGQYVLDLAGGTGDLTEKFSFVVGDTGLVVLADINSSMLKIGRDKLRNKGIINNVIYIQANAETLPFPENIFDCVSIGFGLRNVTDMTKALTSILRVLKIGGRLLVLEFSKPQCAFLSTLFDIYSFQILPHLGSLIVQDASSYRYLAESIRMHPDQDTLERAMINVGFCHTTYQNFTGGIVALHRGFKF